MVIKRRGAERPVVAACTLVPYDDQFEMGHSLTGARSPGGDAVAVAGIREINSP